MKFLSRIFRNHIASLLAAAVLLGAGSTPALAATGPLGGNTVLNEQEALIENLLELSGINEVAAEMRIDLIHEQDDHTGLPEDQILMIKNILNRYYRSEDFLRTIKNKLAAKFDNSHALAMLKWYQTPLGKQIVRQELRVLNLETNEEVQRFNDRIKLYPPGEDRLSLVERLEEALKSSDYTIEIALAFVRLLLPVNEKFQGKSFHSVIREFRTEMQEFAREDALRSLLFIYKDIPDDDLLNYVKLAESKPGRWFFTTYYDGSMKMMDGLVGKVERLMTQMAEEMESGGGDSPLLREFAPAGQRYLFVRKRDPFVPLVNKNTGLLDSVPKKIEDDNFEKVMGELKDLPPIPLVVYKKIKTQNPRLHADLENYARLFKGEGDLDSMDEEEYIETIEKYKRLIQKANESKVELILTDIQIDYESLSLVGVIARGEESLALVQTRDQKGHTVKKGSLMGPNFGVVDTIGLDKIIIIERSRDYLGDILTRQRKIKFIQESLGEG